MSNFKNSLKSANIDDLNVIVKENNDEYIVYTAVSDLSLSIGVSDGAAVWKSEIDQTELDVQKDIVGVDDVDTFLARIRSSIIDNQLSVSQKGLKLDLTIGSGTNSCIFELFEMKSSDTRQEIKTLLFKYAQKSLTLEKEIGSLNKKVDNLQATKPAGNIFMDDGKKQSSPTRPKAKKVGMSVINPSSKKRKAAKGVVYD